MKRTIRFYRLMWTRHDLPAGLTVFLVALPLCLGIANASGAPVYAGLLSGIIGGLIVSFLSGSHLSVSGPAAGLTTIVAGSIISLGGYSVFLLAVVVAGVFQLLLSVLKAGKISNYFPSSVIKGMLAAIGIMLISKQIPMALGLDKPDFWNSGFSQLFTSTEFSSNFKNLNQHITRGALIITVVSLAILIIWQQPFAKKLRVIPAPLAVVITGILLHLLFTHGMPGFFLRPTQSVLVPSNVFAEIRFPDFSQLFSNVEIWKAGLLIGGLASLETLLCVEAVDKLDRHNRITPVNRELMAQGVGNIACGLLGAIPMTAVVVRGAANADAGARTKLSSFTHGAFLLLAVMLIPFLLNMIPLASLAAILIMTGYNLAKPKLFRNLWSLGLKQFLPFIITIVVILSTDLLIGVSIGLLISIYFIVQSNFRDEFRITRSKHLDLETYVIKLNSNVTFLNKVKLRDSLDKIPEYSVLYIDGTDCTYIDYDILEIISEYSSKAHDRHIELHLKGIEKVSVTAVH
ncbi:MAG TPA: SulP family inorganic anion transporter [Chitinophagaceae bacterium]|nr:SulP family inorganic anion transporter [Chitinophagaceae bacterium]HPH33671.1 SulP family inorganic anion transporter [Chitinophagaceae bacterium]